MTLDAKLAFRKKGNQPDTSNGDAANYRFHPGALPAASPYRVEIPALANGIALYGGTNNSVTDNYVADQPTEGQKWPEEGSFRCATKKVLLNGKITRIMKEVIQTFKIKGG